MTGPNGHPPPAGTKGARPAGGRHAQLVRRLREAVLAGPGVTSPAARQAAERLAAAPAAPASGEAGALPPALAAYAEQVARAALRITDDDVRALLRAGYSEDAVFEVTVAAALGAGLGRLERGLRLLEGVG